MIGFLVNEFERNQITYCLTKNLNIIGNKQVMVFYNTLTNKYVPNNFCMMDMVDAYGFDGTLIATDIVTARDIRYITCKKKMFYVCNFEWAYLLNKQYHFMKKMYDNQEIDLIARSQDHYDILSSVWKKPKCIIKDFDHKDIVENLL